MGLAGTDVAKEAADMILTDDNFASIVHAVEEGRAVYANIRKFAVYVFNSNMAESRTIYPVPLLARVDPIAMTVMQVLAIDLGTDMVPAIGLGAEPPEAGVMRLPPRSQKKPLLNARLWQGVVMVRNDRISCFNVSLFFLTGSWLAGVPLASEGTLLYRMLPQ